MSNMQLKLGSIMRLASDLMKEGMTLSEVENLPVYIGRDDELNGIHTAWYAQQIDPANEDDGYFFELIEEDSTNVECTGKAILIS